MRRSNRVPLRELNPLPSGALQPAPPQKQIRLEQDAIQTQRASRGVCGGSVNVESMTVDYDSDGGASVIPSVETEDVRMETSIICALLIAFSGPFFCSR